MEGRTMRQTLNAVSEPMHGEAMGSPSWHLKAAFLHAVLSRHLREFLLSSATLLSISLFTIVTIVVIVTTVNSSIASADTWSRWSSDPVTSTDEGLSATTGLASAVDAKGGGAYQPDWASEYPDNPGYAALPVSGN